MITINVIQPNYLGAQNHVPLEYFKIQDLLFTLQPTQTSMFKSTGKTPKLKIQMPQ